MGKCINKGFLNESFAKIFTKSRWRKSWIEKWKRSQKENNKTYFSKISSIRCCNKINRWCKTNGSGKNYLIQHSAGSGKSNSIAWLAYQLSELHDINNKPIFTSVIVINDRTILDRQTSNTIYGFDHINGIVEKIDDNKHSSDLKKAINDGKKIIITTLQKFPYIYDEINDTTDRRFAIIVDEAHNSQTGKSAQKLKAALADTEEALKEYAEIEGKAEDEIKDEEDKLVEQMLSHGMHKNLSFFAFTATPKEKTLEMFGVKTPEGKFRPFHIYSMRQAIDEGFILDVLKNFMYYKTCIKLQKKQVKIQKYLQMLQ